MKIIRFLGSVYLAVVLIALAALAAIFGTVIESKTESHLFAEQLIYRHPLFITLLGLFFVNILVSALLRFPFKWRHVPFLVTHLGLLMIISGVIYKQLYGVQGQMIVLEGSGSHTLISPHTYALELTDREGNRTNLPIKSLKGSGIALEHFFPHSKETQESWIKGDYAYLYGFPPLKFVDADVEKTMTAATQKEGWNVYALKTDNLEKTVKKVYRQELRLTKKNRVSPEEKIKTQLTISPEKSILTAKSGIHRAEIHLDRDLTVRNLSTAHIGGSPLEIEIKQKPSLLFIKEGDQTHFISFDENGGIFFAPKDVDAVMVYDNGFGGYSRQQAVEKTVVPSHQILVDELQKGTFEVLSPPLQLLYEACERCQLPFAETTIEFLSWWDQQHSWFIEDGASLPPKFFSLFRNFNWGPEHASIKKGVLWARQFFHSFNKKQLMKGHIMSVLEKKGWPLLDQIREVKTPHEQLMHLTQQFLVVADQLPPPEPVEESPLLHAQLFSAYLRAYDLHLATIFPQEMSERVVAETFETPLTLHHQFLPVPRKREEALPALVFKHGEKKYSLSYDPYNTKLAWPISGGEYLARFHTDEKAIPWHVRVREARQVLDITQSQPTGYECRVLITHRKSKEAVESVISMNNVHETWDGYRFYLSSISPADESAVKQVQIVVNHDPAKYWLTYPGGVVLALGIILLFWFRPYRQMR